MSNRKKSAGVILLENWNKNKAQHIKDVENAEDFKYFKKHLEILGKK